MTETTSISERYQTDFDSADASLGGRQRVGAKLLTLIVVLSAFVIISLQGQGTNWIQTGRERMFRRQAREEIAHSPCVQQLRRRVQSLNSEESMRRALHDLTAHAVVKGVDGSKVSSVVHLLRSKHKIGSVGRKLVFLFPTNLVVTADKATCQVSGMYAGQDGKLHPEVDSDALTAKLVAADYGPPPPPPTPPPVTPVVPTFAHDIVSPWIGQAYTSNLHHINGATPPNPGVTSVHGWNNVASTFVFQNSLEFNFTQGAPSLGPYGDHVKKGQKPTWSVRVDKGACITEVQVHWTPAPTYVITGIRFHIMGPNVDRWQLGGGTHGTMTPFNSHGSCLKGAGMMMGVHFLHQVQLFFGYWCPAGMNCTANGYVGRTQCGVGNYGPIAYNRKGCIPANKGYYAPVGSSHEHICMPGTYQDKPAQTSCLAAPVGHFVQVPGAQSAQICRKPYYQPKTGQVACLYASPGFFVNTDGASKQTPCTPGHYQPKSGATTCLVCSLGTFQGLSGQVACMRALPGHYVKSTGAKMETTCAGGTYQPGVGSTQCLNASAGHYVGSSGWARQKACPIGHVQPRVAQTFCLKLPNPGTGVAATTPIPVHLFVPGTLAVTELIGSETLDSGYNLFRGVGAIPVIARRLGYFTNRMKRNVRVDGSLFFVPDQAEYVHNPQCLSSQWSTEFYQSYSVRESMSIARKFSMSLSGSAMAGHSCPPLWSLGVATSASFFYGNSMEMRQSSAQAQQGFSFSSNSFVDSTLYDVHVDWKRPTVPFQFDASLKTMIANINIVRQAGKGLNMLVMTLIESFGSHVIAEATFGSQCSMTMYMESSSSQSAMSSFLSQSSSTDFSKSVYTWFMSVPAQGAATSSVNIKTQSRNTNAFSGTFANGRKYSVKNVQCKGYLKNNLCDRRWSVQDDNPGMIEYIPLPIWEISGAGWQPQGQRNVLWALRDFERALLKCNQVQCGNVGICTTKMSFWDNMVSTGAWDGDFFSRQVENYGMNSIMWNTGCVCVNGIDTSTNKCVAPQAVPSLSPKLQAVAPPYEWVPAQQLGCADACKLGKYGYPPYYAHGGTAKDGICSTQIGPMTFVGSNFDTSMTGRTTHQCLVNYVIPGQAPRDIVATQYDCFCADPTQLVRQVTYRQACYTMCGRIGKNPVSAKGYVMNGTGTDLCIAMEPKFNLRGGYTDMNKCNIWHQVSAPAFECLCF